jgi:CheY-like chemotaxis protein
MFALAIAATLLLHSSAPAQDEDDEPAPAAAPAQAPAPAKAAPKLDLRFEQPVIRSIIEANPTTPKEIVRAVVVLVDLHRPELARPLLNKLMESKPDTNTLLSLAHDFDSATFIKLAGQESLTPEGGQLADAVLSAAQAARTDPALLKQLVSQLVAKDENTRQDAVIGLYKARGAAVAPLVRALIDPARAREHKAVRSMLVRLGGDSVGPLVAMLESHDAVARLQAAQVLGRLKAKPAIQALLVPAVASTSSPELKAAAGQALLDTLGRIPTEPEAAELLSHEARAALEKVKLLRADPQPGVEQWRWDEKLGQSILTQIPPADAAASDAARLAGDAYVLTADTQSRRLFILAQLTAAKLLGGLDHPLAKGEGTVYAQVAAFGPRLVEEVLLTALTEGNATAATAAAEILGDIGQEEILHRSGAALSPLAEAARSGDRRLRFAAIDAILKLKPTRPFAGAGEIPQNLAFFAGTAGFRRAIVAHPRTEKGQQLVGLLSGLDYEADSVSTSRQFMMAATQSPDYELALVDVSLGDPGADDLLARLRRDPRTTDLPIGLVAPANKWSDAERVAQSLPQVTAIPPVRTEAALKFQMARILERAGRDLVTFPERQAQAAVALGWLARLSDDKQRPFDLQAVEPAVARALYVPALSRQAALVLSNLPSAAAQASLVDLAGRNVLPIAARQAAATAFGRSVRLHGVLLTSGQIIEQYNRYNASRTLDQDTQQVLASLLDAIEAHKKAADDPEPQP